MSKFNVGDRVKCICEGLDNYLGYVGEVYTISYIDPAGDLSFVESEPGKKNIGCIASRFVLVETPTPQQIVSAHNSDSKQESTNPKDLLGIKKPQMNLVPMSSILYQAAAMEDGAVKYGPFNWRTKKVKASIYIGAVLRHIAAWQDGEELAEDSGKPHLGHAMACLGIIIDALETGNLEDDRPAKGVSSALIKKWTKK